MDGWMGGWMDGWMNGWMDGWMSGCVFGLRVNGWLCVCGWMDVWMDGCVNFLEQNIMFQWWCSDAKIGLREEFLLLIIIS